MSESHTSTYRYVLQWVHTFLLILVPIFLHFERVTVHTGYMLTLVEYLLWVPDSIARPPARPAGLGLLASDSDSEVQAPWPAHSLPLSEPTWNHRDTQALAGLSTAASSWQHPCQCLSTWVLALVACWGIQLLRVSFTRLAAAMISCLLTSSTSPTGSQQHCARCKWACEGLGIQVGASMMSCKIFKQSCKVQIQRFYQRDK